MAQYLLTLLTIEAAICFGASGCNASEDKPEWEVVAYVRIEGQCHEIHAQEWGNYDGAIVHSRNNSNGANDRSGSVVQKDVASLYERFAHPGRYRPPFMVWFPSVPAEVLKREKMTLLGTSYHRISADEKIPDQYKTICEFWVTERLHELPDRQIQLPLHLRSNTGCSGHSIIVP